MTTTTLPTGAEALFLALNFTEYRTELPFSARLARFAAEAELTVAELTEVLRTVTEAATAALAA